MADSEGSKGDAQTPDWATNTRRVARAIRRRVLRYTIDNNGGYLSQGCSSAEILATLYTHVMRLGESRAPMIPRPFPGVPSASNPDSFTGAAYNGAKGPELDRFFFSPVHYALVLYSTLIEVGRLAPEALDQFNQDGSSVEMIGAEHSPGMEVTGGSLAQVLSQAAGVALARQRRGDSGRVWVFMSDGELQEGQTWEALAAAAWYRLDNLAIVVDVNGQQCDGLMEEVMTIEPLAARVESFGWAVTEVDGHDVVALAAAGDRARAESGRPTAVICRTDPCHGLDSLLRRRAPRLHYVRFASDDEREAYRRALEAMEAEEHTAP